MVSHNNGCSASFNQQTYRKQAYAGTMLGLARLTLTADHVREDELDWKQRCDASGSTRTSQPNEKLCMQT